MFTSSLWAQWMRNHNVKTTPHLRFLTRFLILVLENLLFRVKLNPCCIWSKTGGNGESTYLWYDDWLYQGNLLTVTDLQSPPPLSSHWKVSSIIRNGQRHLTEPALQGVRHLITQVSITHCPNSWKWSSTPDGNCTLHICFNLEWCQRSGSIFFSIKPSLKV